MGNAEAKARKLLRRAGTLRARELVTAGIARAQLTRLVEAGALIRLSRGVYALAERKATTPMMDCGSLQNACHTPVYAC